MVVVVVRIRKEYDPGGAAMQNGTVKWFNAKKGFGFVIVDGIGHDIFVHYSTIEGEGFRTLAEGDAVLVDVGDDGKGPRARRVTRANGAGQGDSDSDSNSDPETG